MPTSVSLNPYFENFIKEQLESGRYNNVSEVVRAGLRLLEEQQKQIEALRAAVWDGVSYEDSIPAEEVFGRLLERYSNWDKHKDTE
jgi:antitoxin ParD1/3/4